MLRLGLVSAVASVSLAWSATAVAASTYTLCSGGPGKPLVSPGPAGRCPSGQQMLVLGSGTALVSLQDQVRTLKDEVTTLQGQVSTLQGNDATLQGQVSTLQGDDSSTSGRVSTLEGQVGTLNTTFSGVSRTGSTLLFSGMNLQIESGSGATDARTNGLGNLIIGYNENPGAQTGSHNLILGNQQSFTSYGGIIAGQENTVSGPYSDAFGLHNTASGNASSVSGGEENTAASDESSISGGYINATGGRHASVSGGTFNHANGEESSVSGGSNDVASGAASSASGGFNNNAGGSDSSISGGADNGTGGTNSSVSGGSQNKARGSDSSISGGDSNYTLEDGSSISGGKSNFANEVYGTILGGCFNIIGPTPMNSSDPSCTSLPGAFDTIGGGYDNQAVGGLGVFVAGGNHNTGNGVNSVAIGGENNSVAANEGLAMSLFGGESEMLSSPTNGESQVGSTLESP